MGIAAKTDVTPLFVTFGTSCPLRQGSAYISSNSNISTRYFIKGNILALRGKFISHNCLDVAFARAIFNLKGRKTPNSVSYKGRCIFIKFTNRKELRKKSINQTIL